jgi:hypothetical protein
MRREQIRVRVDIEQWEGLKAAGEGNTELLERILSDWAQLRRILSDLTAIDANPSQALGRLLASHELFSTALVTVQPQVAPLAVIPAAPESPPSSVALIGGIENNGDDW